MAGNLGAESRLEFTIIGDTVNVSSRLHETAKQMDCEFLISESTYSEVANWVQVGKQSEVEIRGRKQPLHVYEIVGENDDRDAASDAVLTTQPVLEKS